LLELDDILTGLLPFATDIADWRLSGHSDLDHDQNCPDTWGRLPVELDPDIEEHSPSDPNDALGAPSPEMTKSSKKKEKGMKKAVLGLSFMEKEQEKITLQPNIYRKENKQHQIENQRLSSHHLRP
jgi:hypothetical protein